jgi:hypothetical protein
MDGPNLYRYVHDNPTTYTDPPGQLTGMQAACIGGWILLGTVVVGATVASGGAGGVLVMGIVINGGGAAAGAAAGAITAGIWCQSPPPTICLPRVRIPPWPPEKKDQCEEEWRQAREECAQLLSGPNPPRGITGGYTSVEECARSLVSEECGGNPVSW